MTENLFDEFVAFCGDKLVDPDHNPRTFEFMLKMFNYYHTNQNTK